MAVDFKVVTDGLKFPEGPIAMPDGSVILVEIAAGTITRVAADGAKSTVATPGDGPNGAAFGPDGKLYICNNGGFSWTNQPENRLRPVFQAADYVTGRIERIDITTGTVERVYDRGPNGPLRGPNDIVFDRHGGFYFTDLGKPRPREIDRGGLYYAKTDGSDIREIGFPMLTANGVGLSPDESVVYVAETQPCRVWAFDLVEPGRIKPHPFPSPHGGRLLAGLPGYQLFDSLAVDSAGNVCVATISNGGITVIAPDGAVLEHIPLPDYHVTNICFGGPDLSTAYVTLSGTGRLISFPWPRPGLALNWLNK